MRNPHSKSKLLGYSLLSGAFLIVPSLAKGQYIYKDYDPDSLITVDSISPVFTPLDLNNDGVNDFSFVYTNGGGTWSSTAVPNRRKKIVALGSNEFATIPGGSTYYGAYWCDNQVPGYLPGETIDSGLNWATGTGRLSRKIHIGSGFTSWCGGVDGSLPVRIKVGSGWNYGWIRVKTAGIAAGITLYDQLLNTTPNEAVIAGFAPSSPPTTSPVVLFDFGMVEIGGTTGGSEDICVRFRQAPFAETGIAEYRIFVVPAIDSASFISTYASIPSGNYHTVVPNGSTIYHQPLPAGILSSGGAPISNGTDYYIAVAAMADGVAYMQDTLTVSPEKFNLITGPESPIGVKATDWGDNPSPASDIRFTFEKPASESGIWRYNAVVVPDSIVATFNPCDWAVYSDIPYTNERSMLTGLASYDFYMDAGQLDILSNPIQEGVGYRVFVMGTSADLQPTASFSTFSNLFSLGEGKQLPSGITIPTAMNIVATDADSTGGAADVRVQFDPALDESDISAYRIFVVPVDSVSSFSDIDAVTMPSLSPPRYRTISPTGSSLDFRLVVNHHDIYGNPIQENKAYQIVVLSLSEKFWDPISALSSFSNVVILTTGIISVPIPDDGDDDDMW